jgi:hypothetical protein
LRLPLSGCRYQQVNDLSVLKYRTSDNAADIAINTAGNAVPRTLEAAAGGMVVGTLGVFIPGMAYLQGKSPQ